MAVIEYKCDTCKRFIDIPQNKNGLEIIQKCIITDGCHGKLSQIDYKIDYLRGKFPNKVDNLNDYSKRKIIHNHKQSIKLNEWRIIHNLGVAPLTTVFIERPKILEDLENINLENPDNLVELIEVKPSYINVISANELVIGFDRPEKGISQLITKSSSIETIKPNIKAEDIYIQLSNSKTLTIATVSDDQLIDIELSFLSPTGIETNIQYQVDNNPSITSPWIDYNKLFVNGKTYTVRSFDISNLNIKNGNSFIINDLLQTSNNILLLLTNSPYSTTDKVLNYIGKVPDTLENSINKTMINNGELFLNETQHIRVYPHIKKV